MNNYRVSNWLSFFISRKNVYHHGGSTTSRLEASEGYHPGTSSSRRLADREVCQEVRVCINFLADLVEILALTERL